MADGTVWGGFSRAALDEAYDNARAVPTLVADIERLKTVSAEFRLKHSDGLDIAYGDLPRQRFDLFRSGSPNGALLLFIHGGYWQMREKETFAALAEGPLAAGWDVAMIGYTLAPEASMSQIVDECRMAVRHLTANAQALGLRAEKVCASGWSAGGHLAAMTLEMDEVDAALAISGLFDLEPIRHCYLNDKLRLTAEEAEAQSPMNRLGFAPKPLTIAYGLGELPELQRQSKDYFQARVARSLPTEHLPLSDCDHYSVLPELGNASGRLCKHLATFRGSL